MVIACFPRPSVLDTALRAADRARTKHPGAVYRERILSLPDRRKAPGPCRAATGQRGPCRPAVAAAGPPGPESPATAYHTGRAPPRINGSGCGAHSPPDVPRQTSAARDTSIRTPPTLTSAHPPRQYQPCPSADPQPSENSSAGSSRVQGQKDASGTQLAWRFSKDSENPLS